jgi:hypothetical protein
VTKLPDLPPVMASGDAAAAYVESGGVWSRGCEFCPPPTLIQGGEPGYAAHISTVHPEEVPALF